MGVVAWPAGHASVQTRRAQPGGRHLVNGTWSIVRTLLAVDTLCANIGLRSEVVAFAAPRCGASQLAWCHGLWPGSTPPSAAGPAGAPGAAAVGLSVSPRFRDLRHSHAAWLISAGVPLPVTEQGRVAVVGVGDHPDNPSRPDRGSTGCASSGRLAQVGGTALQRGEHRRAVDRAARGHLEYDQGRYLTAATAVLRGDALLGVVRRLAWQGEVHAEPVGRPARRGAAGERRRPAGLAPEHSLRHAQVSWLVVA